MSKLSFISRCAIACAVLGSIPAVAAAQQINGIKLNERVFNDFTTSTLVTTNTNSNPGTVTITETGYVNDNLGGNFANRHDALMSSDNGATARVLDITNGFTMSTIINLAPTINSPRKEAGLRINSPVTGDALFIVNSDAGEIVAFGGGAPFHIFGSNGASNGYTPGTPLFMGLTYRPGSGSTPGTTEYFINRTAANGMGAGLQSSGQLAWSNLEGGPVNFTIGAYAQIAPNLTLTAADGVNVSFTNLTATIVPEPTTLAALSVGAVMLRRRRV